MSLPAPYEEHYYIGDGTTVTFPFGSDFKALAEANVKCIIYFDDGTNCVPTFTVNMAAGSITIVTLTKPDGTVLTVPPVGSVVRVFRETPEQQNVTASQLQNYTAKQLEKIFDSIVAMIQENGYTAEHKTLRLTETQRDVSLQNMSEDEDQCLLYWDEESGTIKSTEYTQSGIKLEVERANDVADQAKSIAQTTQGNLTTHTSNINNPHLTSVTNLTDTNITSPANGQFIMFDGSKWKNVFSSATVYWGQVLGNLTDQTDLMNKFAEYVRTDGTSVMTAPLLMRATDDFKCAIAPYWDGVGFFKLNNNNSVTLIASLEYQDSFAPAENNVYNIGSTSKKWKNLYLAGKAYMSVINNGYDIAVPVTNSADTLALLSDIAFKSTDVELTTLASGQFLMYDGSKWINSTQGYANTDLSNLTSTGKNIANWSSNVTNCITEIPQDINLTLSSGTLTLKAGSKCYLKTDTTTPSITIASDLTTTQTTDGTYFAIYDGSTLTTVLTTAYDYSTLPSTYSLPLAIVTVSSSAISSIDHVFNGFGYIGSTIFALPNVKGTIPNGRNADGTLKNTIFTTSSVLTQTFSGGNRQQYCVALSSTSIASFSFKYGEPESGFVTYQEKENYNYASKAKFMSAIIGWLNTSSGKVSLFETNSSFHAVDYNDYQKTVEQVNTNTTNIATKQDVATAVNYNNISNCITEIPQDIKLTLSSGTLTLKAGSKVYVPNGADVFDIHTVASDVSQSSTSAVSDGSVFVFWTSTGLQLRNISQVSSSPTEPTITLFSGWYDTTNNLVKLDSAGTAWQTATVSFPVAVVTVSSGVITSIDQIFNGFGYIGSVIYALPGVKMVAPAGRNTDGTLNNTVFTLDSVKTRPTPATKTHIIAIRSVGFLADNDYKYNESDNYIYYNGIMNNICIIGSYTSQNNRVISLKIKQPFHAVDMSEADYVVESQEPTAENDYTWYRKYKSGWVEQGGIDTITATTFTNFNLIVPMADTHYFASGNCTDTVSSVYTLCFNPSLFTTTTFSAKTGNASSGNFTWEVKGMGA